MSIPLTRTLRSSSRRVLFAIIMTALGAGSSAFAAEDSFTGVWVLNPAKSAGATGRQVLTIRVEGEEETYRSDLTDAEGVRQVTTYVARYNGKAYPSRTVLSGGPGGPSVREGGVILHKTDALTRERHWMQDGRLIRVLYRRVSPDGATLRSQLVDHAADGAERRGAELVFDRRSPPSGGE